MAVKLNKPIAEIIAGFGSYLAAGLQEHAPDIAEIKSLLATKTVDIDRFDEYITYADNFKVAPNRTRPTYNEVLYSMCNLMHTQINRDSDKYRDICKKNHRNVQNQW